LMRATSNFAVRTVTIEVDPEHATAGAAS
jgi:hypothetical protein